MKLPRKGIPNATGRTACLASFFAFISGSKFETHPVIRTDLRISVTPGMVDLKGSAVSYNVETNVVAGTQGI